jgi:heme-degrading monooxygenase HmoA
VAELCRRRDEQGFKIVTDWDTYKIITKWQKHLTK